MSCISLISVVISTNLTSIPGSAFTGCSSLKSVTIPDRITSLGDRAFGSCGSLTRVTIPYNVTGIGASAFASCGSLTNVMVGKSVTNIAGYAWAACTELAAIFFQGDAPTAPHCVLQRQQHQDLLRARDPELEVIVCRAPNSAVESIDAIPGSAGWHIRFNITGTMNIPIVVEGCTRLGGASWTPIILHPHQWVTVLQWRHVDKLSCSFLPHSAPVTWATCWQPAGHRRSLHRLRFCFAATPLLSEGAGVERWRGLEDSACNPPAQGHSRVV